MRAAPAIVRPDALLGAKTMKLAAPCVRICFIMASIVLAGITDILNTPFPTADMSEVNDSAGMSDDFVSRNMRAFSANNGPIIISGFDDRAVLIAVVAFAVS